MVGLNATNLGDQAQTKRLITQDISALNYQQPFQQLGTHASPQPAGLVATIPYTAGYNKYVLYIDAPLSGALGGINTTLQITGAPIILSGSSTVSGSCEYIVSGLAPVIGIDPEYTTITKILNNTTVLSSTVLLQMYGILTLPTYVGTACLKLVLNFNLD